MKTTLGYRINDAEHMSHHIHAGSRGAASIPGPTSRDLYRKRFTQPQEVLNQTTRVKIHIKLLCFISYRNFDEISMLLLFTIKLYHSPHCKMDGSIQQARVLNYFRTQELLKPVIRHISFPLFLNKRLLCMVIIIKR